MGIKRQPFCAAPAPCSPLEIGDVTIGDIDVDVDFTPVIDAINALCDCLNITVEAPIITFEPDIDDQPVFYDINGIITTGTIEILDACDERCACTTCTLPPDECDCAPEDFPLLAQTFGGLIS